MPPNKGRKPKALPPLTEKERQDWDDMFDLNMSPERGKLSLNVSCERILLTTPQVPSRFRTILINFWYRVLTISQLLPTSRAHLPHVVRSLVLFLTNLRKLPRQLPPTSRTQHYPHEL